MPAERPILAKSGTQRTLLLLRPARQTSQQLRVTSCQQPPVLVRSHKRAVASVLQSGSLQVLGLYCGVGHP